MAPAAVRALEETRLAEQLAYNHAASGFLAAKLDGAGLALSDIRTVADLAAVPFMEKSELSDSQRGRRPARRQPLRTARGRRPDPGHRWHDRRAAADRLDAPRPGDLRRDGRPRALGDGLPAGRRRVHVHELQPLHGRPERPPDVRDGGRRDDSVRRRRHRAAAADDGRDRGAEGDLGDAVLRGAAGRGGGGARARAAGDRAARRVLLGRGRPAGARLPRPDRGAVGDAGARHVRDRRARHALRRVRVPGRPPLRRHRLRADGADRSRHGRGRGVRRRSDRRGGAHLDPPAGVPAAAHAHARPRAGLHRAVPVRSHARRASACSAAPTTCSS